MFVCERERERETVCVCEGCMGGGWVVGWRMHACMCV